MKSIAKRPLLMLSVASVLLAFGVVASGETADALLRRYPYDPACPWGRISNGKGMILRCVTEGEAQALRSGALPVSTAPSSPQGAAPAGSAAPTATATTAPASAPAATSASSDEPS